jgi:LysE type translocator
MCFTLVRKLPGKPLRITWSRGFPPRDHVRRASNCSSGISLVPTIFRGWADHRLAWHPIPNISAVLAFSSNHAGPCDLFRLHCCCARHAGHAGTDMALVIGRGVGQSHRVAFCTVLGFMAAGLIQVPLLVLGVASLLHASPLAFDLMRWRGAAYLIWLGSSCYGPDTGMASVLQRAGAHLR